MKINKWISFLKRKKKRIETKHWFIRGTRKTSLFRKALLEKLKISHQTQSTKLTRWLQIKWFETMPHNKCSYQWIHHHDSAMVTLFFPFINTILRCFCSLNKQIKLKMSFIRKRKLTSLWQNVGPTSIENQYGSVY